MYSYGYSSYGYGAELIGIILLVLVGLIAAVMAILSFVAWCKAFTKAGIPWERMFVPFYGQYTQYSIAGAGAIFWINLLAPIAMSIITTVMTLIHPYVGLFFYFVFLVLIFVLHCFYCVKLARAFGYGGGFAVGLILLNPIFIMILGFGSSTYMGANGYSGAGSASVGGTPAHLWKCSSCGSLNPEYLGTCPNCRMPH